MKKTLAFLSVLLFVSVSAAAQDSRAPLQVKVSLDRNSAHYMHAIQILYIDREELASQTERASWHVSVTQLRDLSRRFGLKYGVSLSDRGYREDLLFIHFVENRFERSHTNIRMTYLGVPLSLAFNLNNNKRMVSGFAEAGILPEILLHQSKSDFLNYDLRNWGLSWFVNTGIKMNFGNRYALVVSPEVRFAVAPYDKNRQKNPFDIVDFRPISTGITMGVQF